MHIISQVEQAAVDQEESNQKIRDLKLVIETSSRDLTTLPQAEVESVEQLADTVPLLLQNILL